MMSPSIEIDENRHARCLFCNVDDARPLVKRASPRHVVCRRCGFVYQNPKPSKRQLHEHYQRTYWDARQADVALDTSDSSARGQKIVEWTASLVPADKWIIEIGCGPADILAHVAPELDCHALGIEPDPNVARLAAERHGFEVISGTTADLASRDVPVHLVIMSHVLEHVWDLRADVAVIRGCLKRGGYFYVEVPNILRPSNRKRYSNWLTMEHLYYFSPQTLKAVLTEGGFETVREECEGDVVRVLVKAGDPSSHEKQPNEYTAVIRAKWWHEAIYWPRYIAQRLFKLISRR